MLEKRKDREMELVHENIKANLPKEQKEQNVSDHSGSVPDLARELKLAKEEFDHEKKLFEHRLVDKDIHIHRVEQEKETTRQEADMARQEAYMARQEAAKLEDTLLQERQARDQEKNHAHCTTERLRLALEEEERESEEIRRNIEGERGSPCSRRAVETRNG